MDILSSLGHVAYPQSFTCLWILSFIIPHLSTTPLSLTIIQCSYLPNCLFFWGLWGSRYCFHACIVLRGWERYLYKMNMEREKGSLIGISCPWSFKFYFNPSILNIKSWVGHKRQADDDLTFCLVEPRNPLTILLCNLCIVIHLSSWNHGILVMDFLNDCVSMAQSHNTCELVSLFVSDDIIDVAFCSGFLQDTWFQILSLLWTYNLQPHLWIHSLLLNIDTYIYMYLYTFYTVVLLT